MHVLLQAFLNSAQGSPALDHHTWLHSSLLINIRPYHNKPFPWNACDSQVLQSYKPAIPQASAHRRVFLSDLPMFPASRASRSYTPQTQPNITIERSRGFLLRNTTIATFNRNPIYQIPSYSFALILNHNLTTFPSLLVTKTHHHHIFLRQARWGMGRPADECRVVDLHVWREFPGL